MIARNGILSLMFICECVGSAGCEGYIEAKRDFTNKQRHEQAAHEVTCLFMFVLIRG